MEQEEKKNINKEELERLLKEKGMLKNKREMSEETEYILIKVLNAKSLYPLINRVLGRIGKYYPSLFYPLKEAILKSSLRIDPYTYLGIATAIAISLAVLLISSVIGAFLYFKSLALLFIGLFLSLFLSIVVVYGIAYIYPFYLVAKRKNNIDTELPFAITHLAAVSYASVPLHESFKMMLQLGDYGELTKEIKSIVERVDVYGEDISTAIKRVAYTTPSERFKTLLLGMISILESGGNMRDYLHNVARQELFNYKLERKKYIESLSTYADIYTAVLITAPLFLVTILSIINLVPGSSIMGMDPKTIMMAGTYVIIPMINILYLLFLEMTQPKI